MVLVILSVHNSYRMHPYRVHLMHVCVYKGYRRQPCVNYQIMTIKFKVNFTVRILLQITTNEIMYNYVLRLAERWRTFKLMFVSNEDLFNLCLNLELFACLATGNLVLDSVFALQTPLSNLPVKLPVWLQCIITPIFTSRFPK